MEDGWPGYSVSGSEGQEANRRPRISPMLLRTSCAPRPDTSIRATRVCSHYHFGSGSAGLGITTLNATSPERPRLRGLQSHRSGERRLLQCADIHERGWRIVLPPSRTRQQGPGRVADPAPGHSSLRALEAFDPVEHPTRLPGLTCVPFRVTSSAIMWKSDPSRH